MQQLKISRITSSLALSGLLMAASPALAIVDGEVSVGQRSGTWKQSGEEGKSLSSSSLQLAVHLDPIPLVPVSFGVRMISDAYDAKVADHGVKSLTSTAVVPEVTAWLPIGDLKPFARVGYTAVSAYKGTAEVSAAGQTISGTIALKSSGPRLAAGLDWHPLPFISILAAFEYSTEKLTVDTKKIGDFTITDEGDDSYNSTAILLGVKAGI